MRKVEFWLITFVLLLLSLVVVGCNEQQVEQKVTGNPQELLVKLSADWIEKYGDSLESQLTANTILIIQVINRQGEAIKQLNERLIALEEFNTIDPNETKWFINHFFTEPNFDVQLGLRSDGVIVGKEMEKIIMKTIMESDKK